MISKEIEDVHVLGINLFLYNYASLNKMSRQKLEICENNVRYYEELF